jgi:hypothetical protein
MFHKLADISRTRFIRIEVAIFGIVGVIALLFHFNYGTGLVVVGALTMLLRFSATPRNNLPMATGSYTMEKQVLKDVQDTRQMRRTYELFNDLFVVGAVPLVIGIVLSVIFR